MMRPLMRVTISRTTPSISGRSKHRPNSSMSLGVKGDYYFCTGALREDLAGDATIVASLKRAVTESGATIGSHNGGLKNPVNSALLQGDYDYWHWGPDEALDTAPPGYPGRQGLCFGVAPGLVSGYRRVAGRARQRPGRVRRSRHLPAHSGSPPTATRLREDSREILEPWQRHTAANRR